MNSDDERPGVEANDDQLPVEDLASNAVDPQTAEGVKGGDGGVDAPDIKITKQVDKASTHIPITTPWKV
jgi:hypothetical protein